MKTSKLFIGLILAGITFSLSLSCNRKKDTIAKVFVYDESKNAISGAQVILYADPSVNSNGKKLIANDTAITNVSGEAIFNFNDLYKEGQSGVAVLNIAASKGSLTGSGNIQIVEEVTSESSVYIK